MPVPAALIDFAATLVEPTLFVNGAGVVCWANNPAQRQFEMSGAAMIGTRLHRLTEESEAYVADFLRLCSRRRRPAPGRFRWRVGGQIGCVDSLSKRCSGALIRPGNGASALLCIRILADNQRSIIAFDALNRKIHEQKQALRALASSQAQFQTERDKAMVTLYSIGDAVITTGAGGRIERINYVASRLTGWSEAEAIGRPLSEVFHVIDEESREPIVDLTARRLRREPDPCLPGYALLVSRDGTEYVIEDSAAPIHREDGVLLGAVIVFRDVTKERLARQQLEFLARHDSLTKLHNRAFFEERLEDAFQDAARAGARHAMIYIDLDRFKQVNDNVGHHAGDQLLISVASYLESHVRAGDTLARLGGDEFGLLALDVDAASALALAEDITGGLQQYLLVRMEQRYGVSASAGVAMIGDCSRSAAEAMRKADIACYISKHAGRGTARLYNEHDQSAISALVGMTLTDDRRREQSGTARDNTCAR